MIEPIRGVIGAYDVSCSLCGIVERFEDIRFGLLFIRLRAKGWRAVPVSALAGRHYCPDCDAPA